MLDLLVRNLHISCSLLSKHGYLIRVNDSGGLWRPITAKIPHSKFNMLVLKTVSCRLHERATLLPCPRNGVGVPLAGFKRGLHSELERCVHKAAFEYLCAQNRNRILAVFQINLTDKVS